MIGRLEEHSMISVFGSLTQMVIHTLNTTPWVGIQPTAKRRAVVLGEFARAVVEQV